MKRCFLLIFLVLGVNGSQAQDTIRFLDPCLIYPRIPAFTGSPLDWDCVSTGYLTDASGMNFVPSNEMYNAQFTTFIEPSHPRVYGVAFTTSEDSPSTLPPHIRVRFFSNVKFDDNGNEIESLNIDSIDTDSSFYQKNMYYTYRYGDDDSVTVPCQLYFFNRLQGDYPDTFFVDMETSLGPSTNYGALCNEYNWHFSRIKDINGLRNEVYYRRRPGPVMFLYHGWGWGGRFPIRELPCPRMWKPSTILRTGGRTTLGWQEGDTALYQLVFHDDQGVLVFETDTLRSNTFVLTDSLLDAVGYNGNRYFDVQVRKACNYMDSPFHTLVWNTYSEPRRFYHLQASPQGIDAIDEPVMTVSPNPAKERLAVESDAGTLQLLDLEGREAMSMRLKGGRTELDVATLPRGIYLLRLITDSGIVTRRVVLL